MRHMEGGDSVLPFVRQFCGPPSSYVWEDSEGVVQEVFVAVGGSRVMFSCQLCLVLGQHDALVAISNRLEPSERLLAFLDGILVEERPDRTEALYTRLSRIEGLTQGSRCIRRRRSCGTKPESLLQEVRF